MMRIAEFIYPWGNGHYSRMMRLNAVLHEYIREPDVHYISRGEIYDKLLATFPDCSDNIHHVMMPVPIDGEMGPDLLRCTLNILLPMAGNPPLVKQIASYLREERRIYNSCGFDFVINDGDMGSNILANKRGIPSMFVTNQFRPQLWASRFYFYPGLEFISRQISKATCIVVADSPPPYTLCEYNLNFTKNVSEKVHYVGHFTNDMHMPRTEETDLERMIRGQDFGYWMRTGNKSTNDGTGKRYGEIFAQDSMKNERRIVSHARKDPRIDSVIGKDGARYTISEAYDKKIDWIQIDVGFLSPQEKESVLEQCSYAVVNGSHTVMGEILGGKQKPVIGMPVYDEHTNNIRWAAQKGLGVLAENTRGAIRGIQSIRRDAESFQEALSDFGSHFVADGARNAARLASCTLQEKR